MAGIILKSPPTIILRQVLALNGLDKRFKNGQRPIAHAFSWWSRRKNDHSQNSSSGNGGPHGDGNQSKGQPRKMAVAVAALAAAAIPILTLKKTKVDPKTHGGIKVTQKMDMDLQNLFRIFGSVGKYPVAVISIHGPSRGGKSFVLSHLARYLKNKGSELSKFKSGTMARFYEPLFSYEVPHDFTSTWGDQRKTVGVQILSEPIWIPVGPKPEDKVAVVLMDCQNIFDDDFTTAEMSMTMYTWCSLLSSIMILNVRRVDQRVFENLQYYSRSFQTILDRLNEHDARISPFYPSQRLIILIRDFQWYPQYEYGLHDNCSAPRRTQYDVSDPEKSCGLSTMSGNYFDTKFCNAEILQQNREGRQEILKNFETTSFFLLPSPGDKFLNKPQPSPPDDLDESFKRQLESFFDTMVKDPKSIVKKKVNGLPMTGNEICEYIDRIEKILADPKLCAKVMPPALQDLTSTATNFVNKEMEEKALNLIHT